MVAPYDFQGRTHRTLLFLDERGSSTFGPIAWAVHRGDLTRPRRKRLWRLVDHLVAVGYLAHDGDGYAMTEAGADLLDDLGGMPTVRIFAKAAA